MGFKHIRRGSTHPNQWDHPSSDASWNFPTSHPVYFRVHEVEAETFIINNSTYSSIHFNPGGAIEYHGSIRVLTKCLAKDHWTKTTWPFSVTTLYAKGFLVDTVPTDMFLNQQSWTQVSRLNNEWWIALKQAAGPSNLAQRGVWGLLDKAKQ